MVDAKGQPIADSTVTCVHTPYATEPAAIDRLTAMTDARGMFSFNLVPGLPYRVWATGPADASGRQWVTAPRGIGASLTFELTAIRQVGATHLMVTGSEAWRAAAPLSLRVFPDASQDASFDVALSGDGEFVLPALPLGVACVGLCGRDGEVTQLQEFRTDAPGSAVDFLPPAELTVQVNDSHGVPVSGAEVEHCAWKLGWQVPGWRRLGRTDAQGQVRARVAVGPPSRWPWPGRFRLRAQKAGRVDAYFGWTVADRAARVDPTEYSGPTLSRTCTLQDPVPLHGALDLHDGNPGSRVRVATLRYGLAEGPDAIGLDGKGGWEWPEAPRSIAAAALCFDLVSGKVPLPRTFVFLARPLAKDWNLSLRDTRDVDIVMTDPKHVPTTDGELLVMAAYEDDIAVPIGRVAPDLHGHAHVRLGEGDWLIQASNAAAAALHHIGRGVEPGTLTMQLLPRHSVRCRVVDADGKPVAGARLRVVESLDAPAAVPDSLRNSWTGPEQQRSCEAVASGADGVVVMPLADPLWLGATVRAISGARKSDEQKVFAGAETIDLVVK